MGDGQGNGLIRSAEMHHPHRSRHSGDEFEPPYLLPVTPHHALNVQKLLRHAREPMDMFTT
jgi:hypothetical protein